MQVFPLQGLVYSETVDSHEPHNRGNLIGCKLFNEIELQELAKAASVMEELFSNIVRSIAAHDAYNEFQDELKKLQSADNYYVAIVDRRFRAYVMEFRLFLEHWKKYISDLKKKNKAYGTVYEELYKDITNEVYDSCEEYVLATVLRNYVVHGYDSINHIHVDGVNNKAEVLRDNLLKINCSTSAKIVIKKQEELIDLKSVAQKSLDALEKVQERLIEYQMTDVIVSAATVLMNAKGRIDNAGIKSNFWMLIEESKPIELLDYKRGLELQRFQDNNGNPVQEGKRVLPLVTQDIDIVYRKLNWDGYLATAIYIQNLWEKGYWKEVQKKYGEKKK